MRHLLIPALLCSLGCGSASSAEDAAVADGKALFVENCASCHGADGKGGGPEAATLNTPHADLTRIAARRDGVWPMLEVMSIIDGYTKRVTQREDMPVIAELSQGPMTDFDTGNGMVLSVPSRLVALANYLEGIQSPRPERYVP
jgi:mono/diheme cytochrome c family protein